LRRSGYHAKLRAMAGIVAAVILFAMLFTVGTSYFIFLNNSNHLYNQALVNRTNAMGDSLLENLILTTLVSSTHIKLYANNTGGVNVNITAVFVLDQGGAVLKCDGRGLPAVTCSNTTPALPIIVNLGKGTPTVDTGYTYVSGTDVIKVITERGSIFTQTYPITPVPLANLAVTTQGAGLLQINFASYKAYNNTGTAPGCNPANTGCQLAATGVLGYTMSSESKAGRYYVFAVDVTNVDPSRSTITLDSNCVLFQVLIPSGAGSNFKSFAWGIGSVSSSGVTQAFSSISFLPGQTQTLYFPIIPGTTGSSWPSSGNFMAVFIYLHGTSGSSPFGQNVPFVTTLYR